MVGAWRYPKSARGWEYESMGNSTVRIEHISKYLTLATFSHWVEMNGDHATIGNNEGR